MQVRDLSWNEHVSKRFNHPLLPRSIRGVIVGKLGCGKTTLLLNLLLGSGWLDYNKLAVFGMSLFQPEYLILKKAFEEKLPKAAIMRLFDLRDEVMKPDVSPSALVEEWAKEIQNKSDIECSFDESFEDVPDPSEMNSSNKNLMIFDDLLLEKQNKCESYYIRGRHSNVDCFYLSQNYFKLPRQTIRENANFICLLFQDSKNINNIYSDHVSQDMSKEQFRSLCKKAWEDSHGFVDIDLSSKKNNRKYRKNFDEFYFI